MKKESHFQQDRECFIRFLPVLFGLGLLVLTGCIIDPDMDDDFKKDLGQAVAMIEAEQAARRAEMEAREAARRAEMEAQEAARRAEMEKIKARLTDMSNAEIAAAENDCTEEYNRKRTALCDALAERQDLVVIALVEFQQRKEEEERKSHLAAIQKVRGLITAMSDEEFVAAVDDCRKNNKRTFFCEVIAQSEDLVEAVKARRIAALLQEKTDDEVLKMRIKNCQWKEKLLQCQIPSGAYAQIKERIYKEYMSNLDKLKEDYNYCFEEGQRLKSLHGGSARHKFLSETARCVVAANTIGLLNERANRAESSDWKHIYIWAELMR